MNEDARTLSIINNYLEATGLGEARRFSLTPAEYLLFRNQAIEESKAGHVSGAPAKETVQPIPFPPVETRAEKKPEKSKAPVNITYADDSLDDEEEDGGIESLLRGIPG